MPLPSVKSEPVTWPDEAPESFEFSSFNDTLANQKLVKNVWEMVGNEAEAWNAMRQPYIWQHAPTDDTVAFARKTRYSPVRLW